MATLSENQSEIFTYLSWDSEFFGMRIGRINIPQVDAKQMHTALEWARENSIDCLYFIADAGHPSTIRLAEEHGFRLCEVRLTYERNLEEWQPMPIPRPFGDVLIRQAAQQDIPTMQELARRAYTTTHYVVDPLFPAEKVENFYTTWVKNSMAGFDDIVLVAEAQSTDDTSGEVVAFITGRFAAETSIGPIAKEPRKSILSLIGVKPGLRKKGVGGELIRAAFDWLVQNGAYQTTVTVQAPNFAVRRTIERLGFLSTSAHLYYHKWFQPGQKAV